MLEAFTNAAPCVDLICSTIMGGLIIAKTAACLYHKGIDFCFGFVCLFVFPCFHTHAHTTRELLSCWKPSFSNIKNLKPIRFSNIKPSFCISSKTQNTTKFPSNHTHNPAILGYILWEREKLQTLKITHLPKLPHLNFHTYQNSIDELKKFRSPRMKMTKYFSVISNSKPREAESRRQSFKDGHRWLLLRRRECVWDWERKGFGARGKEREVENSLTWWEKK